MEDASVFAQQADVLFLLGDDALVLRPQALFAAGEDEGVAVYASAVVSHLSAGVVDGVVVIVGVNHPMVVIWVQRQGEDRGGEGVGEEGGSLEFGRQVLDTEIEQTLAQTVGH